MVGGQWKLQGNKQMSSLFPPHSSDKTALHGKKDANAVAIAFVALLKTCAKQKDLHKGSRLHTDIAKSGLLKHNVFVGSALVSMYVKCGALGKAQEVFDKLPIRNEVSWNTLIAGYAQQGNGEEALDCFERMQSSCFVPNAFTYGCILKACGHLRALDKGQEIHAQVVRECLLEKDIVVASALVDMYTKCGELEKAQEVFDELPIQDKVLWTTLIAGYAQHGHGDEAIKCFELMQLGGFTPDAVTFACTLKACGSIGACEKGEEIHSQIVRRHLLAKDILVGTALVDMYAKCGALEKAQEVFDGLDTRNVVLWNALIAGHTQHEYAERAIHFFRRMQLEGLCPTIVTFSCILKACGSLRASEIGQEVHAQIAGEHSLEVDIVVGNALIDMYAKCGVLSKAQEVFDEILVRDKVSWTALITGYTQHGDGEEALNYFERMQIGGFSPDAVTFSSILKACGSMQALTKGEEIHAQIVKDQFLTRDIVVGNALLDMYAKCGALKKAQEVFNGLQVRTVVSWNSIIAAYAQHERCEESLYYFERMQHDGFHPDTVTFASILKACGNAGAAYTGQMLHAEIVRRGLLGQGIIGNALAAMYSNCGMLAEAQELFEKLPFRDMVLWSAFMLGFAHLGKDETVFSLFDGMVADKVEPNSVIFTIVLNTCSHGGLLDKGRMCFEIMSKVYGIIPTVEHHACLVDLFCRARHLEMAVAVITEMPFFPDLLMWHTLLSACQKWGNLELGKWVFEHAVELDEIDAATYVCIGNMFAAAGRQEDADNIEAIRMKRLKWRQLRTSWWNGETRSVRLICVETKGYLQSEDSCVKLGWKALKPVQKEFVPNSYRLAQNNCDDAELQEKSMKLAIASAYCRDFTYTLPKLCTVWVIAICSPLLLASHVHNFCQRCNLPSYFGGWIVCSQGFVVIVKLNCIIIPIIRFIEVLNGSKHDKF